ncbi:MAG TPA: hypothetical protein VGO95_02040 [Modestobacter sp.]|jgi:hypothetical protein|nr:hypothetical protein [Modestobacter sp.]
MDLADVADELYAVPPEDFIAERTAARDRAKAAGDKPLATDIGGLPKPSTAAWVCNLLVRRRREEITQLVELGGLMREAQANLSGDQLKELGKQRSQVVAALTRQARALAAGEGHPVSTAIAEQVEETLRAAVADPDAGAALLGGRLTGALSYTGFGPVDLSGAVAPTKAAQPAEKPGRESSAVDGDRTAREQRREEAEERARREAEEARRRELAQAGQDAEEAAAVARDTAAAAETAEQRVAATAARRQELQARVAELQQELRRTEQRVTATGTDLQEAEHRRDAAVRRAQTAASIRDRSQQRLERLRREAAADG